MSRKIISCVILVAFICFDFACMVYTTKKVGVEQAVGRQTVILAVATRSGEFFEFPKEYPGQIVGDNVAGSRYVPIVFDVADIEIRTKNNIFDKTEIIKTRNGKVMTLKNVQTLDGKINALLLAKLDIPLSEVELLWVKKINAPLTFLAVVGGIAVGSLGVLALIALMKESCPFLYSFDGEGFVFDAEPYGGAICEGLKRTEWCEMESLREVDGRYRLRMTNEVDETQYTDELSLVAVDHPADVLVVPDPNGTFHTLDRPLPALEAYDQHGRDVSAQVLNRDWIYWKTPENEISTESDSWKDVITFEFPKPEGAQKVKFLFNGCNTLWASHMIKRMLELNGTDVQEFYRQVNSQGEAYFLRQPWMLREEIFRLQIRVDVNGIWKSRGLLIGGGPFVSEDRVYVLDIKDIPGDVLRVKLTPPKGMWMINRLAVDYSDDMAVAETSITPVEARDHRGRDIRGSLSMKDGIYFVMPRTGDWAEMSFIAPPRRSGLDRTVFARVSGYYDIHLNASGEPQAELLESFRSKPGAFVQYACREYSKWKAQMERSKAAR